jgi:hypothetical protein
MNCADEIPVYFNSVNFVNLAAYFGGKAGRLIPQISFKFTDFKSGIS